MHPNEFLDQLRSNMNQIKPVQTPLHGSPKKLFVHPELQRCDYVFVRVDSVKKNLQRPYNGPYKVLSRSDKTFQLEMNKDLIKWISIDRLKPSFLLNVSDDTTNKINSDSKTNGDSKTINGDSRRNDDTKSETDISVQPEVKPNSVTRSGRIIKPPVKFQ